MKNNDLKFLANLAKQRLMNKNYSEVKTQSRNRASNYFIENAKALKRLKGETSYVRIKNDDDVQFAEKVKKILENDCYNPLGLLCDESYFNTLSASEKQFYILKLSEKFIRVKEEVLCG